MSDVGEDYHAAKWTANMAAVVDEMLPEINTVLCPDGRHRPNLSAPNSRPLARRRTRIPVPDVHPA